MRSGPAIVLRCWSSCVSAVSAVALGTGPGWHDQGSDLAADTLLFVGAIGRERGNRVRDVIVQGTDLEGVIHVARRQ
jgi:hypothetical protein